MDRVNWDADVKARFPSWLTDAALAQWPLVKQQLSIGQVVTGEVISRAPFGVWLDIGVPFPALLLVVNMKGAKVRRITFDDYPTKGIVIEGRINALSEGGEIGVTQLNLDTMIDNENAK